jgi:hypothetical protein
MNRPIIPDHAPRSPNSATASWARVKRFLAALLAKFLIVMREQQHGAVCDMTVGTNLGNFMVGHS